MAGHVTANINARLKRSTPKAQPSDGLTTIGQPGSVAASATDEAPCGSIAGELRSVQTVENRKDHRCRCACPDCWNAAVRTRCVRTKKGGALPRTVGDWTISHRKCRRGVALAAVLAIHVALVMILMRSARPPVTLQDEYGSLLLIDIPPAFSPPVERRRDFPRTPAHRTRPQPNRSDQKADAGSIESQPIIQAEPPSAPDWSKEAERAAGDVTARLSESIGKCNEKGDPSSKLPPCPARPRDFEWSPEDQRAGIDHGFLYFRPTKQCVIGFGVSGLLGGCSLGKEEANGHLFDGMKSADRRSSIPDSRDSQR